jgi:sugar lactone lactonase YvrE
MRTGERVSRWTAAVATVAVAIGCLALGAAPAAAKYKEVLSWGGFGFRPGQFENAAGVAFGGSGHIYVADAMAPRVEEFSTADGHFIRQFRTSNAGGLAMVTPTGVAVDRRRRVYVADQGSGDHDGLIWQYTSKGHWLRSWNVATHGRSSRTERPVGVAAGNGSLYVTDKQADFNEPVTPRIEQWALGPTEIREWGSFGDGPGRFRSPEGIAVAPSGHVYMADQISDVIKEFTSSGGFVREFGTGGNGPGKLNEPMGVAVDRHGSVYVANAGNFRVERFDSQGRFISELKINAKPKGLFIDESWVAVDRSDNVYVTDNSTNHVHKFKPIRPQTTITSGPKGKSLKSLVTFKFKSSQPGHGSKFICDLRGPRKKDRVVTDCNLGSSAFYVLRTGHYTLRVTAVDGEGFRDPTPAQRNFSIVDGTPPTVGAPKQRLVEEAQIGSLIPVSFRWSATDNFTDARKLKNSLQERNGDGTTFGTYSTVAGPKAGLKHATLSLAPSFTFDQFRARATDRSGNTRSSHPGPAFRVLPADDGNAFIAYSGTWQTVSDANDYGGTVHTSTQAGASASFTGSYRNVGVVMPRRSALGKANVCVDAACSTVNLHGGTDFRRIVFARNALDPAVTHTVKVTVVSGEVDLDAIVLLG